MTFSLCMIVKNEEAVLARCLDSLSGLMDELIIVDTGSTDRTKEIAASYGAKLYDFPWVNDFAAARNFAFSKASCEYIYSADADEVLEERDRFLFKRLKETLLPEIDIVQMLYTNQLFFNTTYNFDEELRPKLFKRLRSFVWEDPLHESVRLSPVIYDSDIRIKHCPTSEHQGRDFHLLKGVIKKDGKLSNKLHKMYARELFIAGTDSDFMDAENYFRDSLNSDQDLDAILMDCCVIAKCGRLRNDPEALLLASSRALASGNAPSELVFELGEYYRARRDFNEAVIWYYNAAFETESLLNRKYHESFPLIGLHMIYVILGDSENAKRYGTMLKDME
ncbi:MAG: glycosyltransferase family 2 protein [Lachnospiraceae bacterium]|nr:glycosyltransferase family 2 protein [Lachnospiraceae bacterium]